MNDTGSDTRIVLGVVSDTHLMDGDERFKKLVDAYFAECNTILHAGDIIDSSIFDGISKKIVAVRGNMDIESKHPITRTISINGKKIGMIHGYGPKEGIENRIRTAFTDVDCIVYGHTHYPLNKKVGDILFFNPGSPFDKRWAPRNTIGYLEVTAGKITGFIRDVEA